MKIRSICGSFAAFAQVAVQYLNLTGIPSQFCRPLGQGILTFGAFTIGFNLMRRGLSEIDNGFPFQMGGEDF